MPPAWGRFFALWIKDSFANTADRAGVRVEAVRPLSGQKGLQWYERCLGRRKAVILWDCGRL